MSILLQRTFYEILGVDKSASLQELKAAYREKLLSTHPDKTQTGLKDSEIINQIKEAYSILSDPQRRNDYDKELDMNFKKHGFISSGEGLDNVTLDDFKYMEPGNETEQVIFKKDCPRCNAYDSFVLTEDDLADNGTDDGLGGYEILVQCSACSLWLKVHYFDLEDEE
ncbi:hypothetical protein WICMUC_000518 [Wickerhamomyces mucosus]|uniref:Diphthamide biosynthesis protein 4 n=1 Tax=Wickerhamomyces mucosus TaxID=1378264 RepID=A0A9P8PX35_9ASCO|nr:hypothetical protein WICMUC_000518 [Wickerhamomyces mucosus]